MLSLVTDCYRNIVVNAVNCYVFLNTRSIHGSECIFVTNMAIRQYVSYP